MLFWYVTKYALTKGILAIPRSDAGVVGGRYLSVKRGHWNGLWTTEFTDTEPDAKRMAEDMCERKVRAMRKQIGKIETMEIKVVK